MPAPVEEYDASVVHVPQVQVVEKTIEILQLQAIEEIVDIPDIQTVQFTENLIMLLISK